MDWNQDKCLKLIGEYKAKENLWNTRHTAYYNRHQKEAAWQEIADQFGSSVEELKKKIDSLKGSYRREKARTRKRIRTHNNGEYKQYESRWFAYKTLQFLNAKDDNDTVQSIKNESDDEESEVLDDSFDEDRDLDRERIDEESIDLLQTPVAEPALNDNTKKERLKPTKSRSKNKKSGEDPRISEAFRYLQEATAAVKQQKDQCSTFGEYIAEKLRTFDHRLRAIAQHNISNVLFELEMGAYQNSDGHALPQSSIPAESLESNSHMDVPDPVFMEELDLSPKSEPHSPTLSHSSHG